MNEEDETAVMEFLTKRAALLKSRQVQADPYRRGKDYDVLEARRILVVGRKICTKCRQEKPLVEFSISKAHPTGKRSECKDCAALRFSEYRRRDPVGLRIKDRLNHYKNKYGMSMEEASSLVKDRTGLCEACMSLEPLVVDHNHETGARRGMLCNRCNRALGLAKDDVDVLIGLVEYLNRN